MQFKKLLKCSCNNKTPKIEVQKGIKFFILLYNTYFQMNKISYQNLITSFCRCKMKSHNKCIGEHIFYSKLLSRMHHSSNNINIHSNTNSNNNNHNSTHNNLFNISQCIISNLKHSTSKSNRIIPDLRIYSLKLFFRK